MPVWRATGAGGFFNVNADQMAVACATAFAADRLVFLTDVEGVLDGEGKTIAELDPAGVDRLIEASGVAEGRGMCRLEAERPAVAAVSGGVRDVCIVSGQRAGVLADLLKGFVSGTTLSRSMEVGQ